MSDVNTEKTIGEILKTTRENLKITIDEVSHILKIKHKIILALEQNDINFVSSHLYLPGFIKSYARLLKIDAHIIEQKIKELSIDSNTNNKKHSLVNIGKKNIHSPNKETFFNAILVFTVLYISLFLIHQFRSDNLITPETIINEFNKIN